MRTNDSGNEWIKAANQFPCCVLVVLERGFDQRTCIRIFHVIENASTLLTKTRLDGLWLQFFQTKLVRVAGSFAKICNRQPQPPVMTYETTPKFSGTEQKSLNKSNI